MLKILNRRMTRIVLGSVAALAVTGSVVALTWPAPAKHPVMASVSSRQNQNPTMAAIATSQASATSPSGSPVSTASSSSTTSATAPASTVPASAAPASRGSTPAPARSGSSTAPPATAPPATAPPATAPPATAPPATAPPTATPTPAPSYSFAVTLNGSTPPGVTTQSIPGGKEMDFTTIASEISVEVSWTGYAQMMYFAQIELCSGGSYPQGGSTTSPYSLPSMANPDTCPIEFSVVVLTLP